MARKRRKTAIDRAIEQLDIDIRIAENELKVLKAARERLATQQPTPAAPGTICVPCAPPEGR